MGVDGCNCLEIRGSKETLDALEASGLALEAEEWRSIAVRFFGPAQIHIVYRTPLHLVVDYEFRNGTIYEYLEALLAANPTCWFKNTYSAEDGHCGLWIGRYHGTDKNIQVHEWMELEPEEREFETDFSRR